MTGAVQASAFGLRQVDLLQDLPAARLETLAHLCAWRPFDKGQRLLAREDGDRDVHFLVAGTLRVTTYSIGGRETSFRDLGAGTSFGELAAIDGRARSADVVALEPGLVASLPPGPFLALLREEWSVNERVLRRLAGLARELVDRVLELSTLNVRQRVCLELLRLAHAGAAAGKAARIEPVPTHGELAHRVSSYREQVTRELSALAKAGVLAREGDALVVPDLARLQRIVDGPASQLAKPVRKRTA